MKLIKTSIYALAISGLLAGCASTAVVSNPIGNVDAIPSKNEPLTDEQLKIWGHLDLVKDTVPGMSVERAYREIIKDKKGVPVVVGVIDSGIDVEHEDLKNVMWINPGEIAGNGIDDDNNGYIDDVYGWNFLGDMLGDNMEFVRIVRKYESKFEGKSASEIPASDKKNFEIYQKAKAEFEKELGETQQNIFQYQMMMSQIQPAHEFISKKLGKEDYTLEDLDKIENPSAEDQQKIIMVAQMLNFGESVPKMIAELERGIEYFTSRMDYHFNTEKDFRGIIGDNPDDITDTNYGDNNVMSIDPTRDNVKHGTHVAGIIAAERNNGLGVNGVANNVKIMAVRAVPDGDEYDKDVALAIRYAVDNGAKILNTSFGKYYSPHAQWVYDAIAYAASKDVLIVNAAGNDGFDLDTINVYPNDQVDNGPEISDSFITVGALNPMYGKNMIANFSNYGKINVDVFAPGVRIYAPTPLDSYEHLSGTSMAAPGVAGVAAVIRSLYPNLTAPQVKKILMDSGISPNIEVVLGGDSSNVKNFREISKSGKMVNMYNALIMAEKMSKK